MDKENAAYMHTEHYSAIKKNEMMPFVASSMDLEHDKQSKSETERQLPHESTYMWDPKYDTNELMDEKETDSQTERTDLGLPRGRAGEGTDWEFAPAWRMDTQGPTAERRELCWIFCSKP